MQISSRIKQELVRHLHDALFSIEKPIPSRRGKVRDIFDRDDTLIMVNTDRVSAFDYVLGTIPLKGALLCEQSEFWFKHTDHICKNHLIDRADEQILVCKKAQPFLVEVIVRGYLAGSLMREDKHSRGASYGLSIDPDMKNYAPFDEPIITPTTKADVGHHDEPISAQEIVARDLLDKNQWQAIEHYAKALFKAGSQRAKENGLLLVDTKYEFGLCGNDVILIDEIHTCDSSRFFSEEDYQEKFKEEKTPTMLDKEFLRQHLLSIGFDPKTFSPIGFTLQEDIRMEVAHRYFMLTEKLIGREFMVPKTSAYERVHQRLTTLIC